MSNALNSDTVLIRNVWNDNLDSEFAIIRDIVDDYPYIAMDTEFPGVVVRPLWNINGSSDEHYRSVRLNVDILKLIQLGFTFSDEKGNLPTFDNKFCVWQFNFREFDPNEDIYAKDSLELLIKSGINFKKNYEKGVDVVRFGELLMSSGIVLNDDVHWVTFDSVYDFGYLVKLLSRRRLPDTLEGFFKLIRIYFPVLYDIKHLMRFCNLHGGLNRLAQLLNVERVGISHQAGSDSLLTSCTYMKLKEEFFNGSTKKYAGVLFAFSLNN